MQPGSQGTDHAKREVANSQSAFETIGHAPISGFLDQRLIELFTFTLKVKSFVLRARS